VLLINLLIRGKMANSDRYKEFKSGISGKMLKELSPDQLTVLVNLKIPVQLSTGFHGDDKVGFLTHYDFLLHGTCADVRMVRLEDGENIDDRDIDKTRRVYFYESFEAGYDVEINKIVENIKSNGGYLFDEDGISDAYYATVKYNICESDDGIGIYPDSEDPIHLCAECHYH
jgi:hypothetical protein